MNTLNEDYDKNYLINDKQLKGLDNPYKQTRLSNHIDVCNRNIQAFFDFENDRVAGFRLKLGTSLKDIHTYYLWDWGGICDITKRRL